MSAFLVDMNIWLHQAVKSRAATGGPRRFLTVLFCRLCKLVYFGIRPVFVFDGEVPTLKKSTMAARRRLRGLLGDRAERAHERLIHRLLKRMAECTGVSSAASASGSQDSTVQSNMGESTKHELLRRLIERPDVQQSHEDAKIFGAPETTDSNSEQDACGLLHENAGLEYDDLARDYLDGVRLHLLDASSQLDLHSPAFCSLPLHAQLRVVQLARDELDTYFRVSGSGQILDTDGPNTTEAFSASQIRRLLLRRQLITRQGELSAQIAREDATTQIARLNSPRLTSALSEQLQLLQTSSTDSTMYTTALRIQSRDTGHAILIKKFPRKSDIVTAGRSNHAVSLPLERLIHRAPDDTTDSEPPHLNNLDVAGPEVVNPDSLISESDSCDHIQLSQKHADDAIPMFRYAQPKEEAEIQTVFSASVVGTPIHEPQSPRTARCAEISFNFPITQSNVLISPSTESSCGPSSSASIETHSIDAEACSSPVCASVAAETDSAEDTDDDDDLVEVPNSDNLVVSSDSPTNISTSDEDTCEDSHEMYPDVIPSLNLGEDEDTFQLDDDVLREQADRLTRQAQTTTTQCIEEAQQLLSMFGMPFVISPEEAEAQCVALQRVGLADFVASDDSDVWPFGAQTVCRHLFGAARGSSDENRAGNRKKAENTKEPCVYRLEDVRHSLGLDSVHIIRLALLCGSDYTVGIQNVGPVTAVEILSEFTRSGGDLSCVSQWSSWLHGLEASDELVSDVVTPLEQFRSWWLTCTKTNLSADPSLNASPVRKKWLKLSPPPGKSSSDP
ncbi:DNA excision repair protein ERCC-5 [Paragonimus westermani]|uniref:DNA excision repair protein ERCC-5 n=1 Tax=Paragonimus westermani TaxID=34504 RepID=A0A5J4NKP6_9TREM|nr:DNA excision repair protein ERCC-5 [Paragonimus westermani]